MSETKTTQNKLAMSRALGAAFLNHQVEQLEKTVSSGGSWRERKVSPQGTGAGGRRPPHSGANNSNGYGKSPRKEDDSRPRGQRRSHEEPKKEADVIVIDASVLIYCLGHVKTWARDGREEVLIVPLEALNTLDLLKKGTSALAQRARTASRVLEAQVGTNGRVLVQSDDAFVPWDAIPFAGEGPAPAQSPEWVRRTICCARFEAGKPAPTTTSKPRVVLAVLSQAGPPPPLHAAKGSDDPASPVPLPAPQLQHKHEPRAGGALVCTWGRRAGLDVLELSPGPGQAEEKPSVRRSAYEPRRVSMSGGGGGGGGGGGPKVTGLVERPPAVKAMMDMVSQPSRPVVRVLARGEKLDPDT